MSLSHIDEDGLGDYGRKSDLQPKFSKPGGGGDHSAMGVRSLCSSTPNTLFYNKYGVGKSFAPSSVSSKGDTSAPTYWFRRLGLLETLETVSKANSSPHGHTHSGAVHEGRVPHSATAAASSYTSLRQAAAHGSKARRRRSHRVVASLALSGSASPGGLAVGGHPVREDGSCADGVVCQKARRMVCEDMESKLMRQVLLKEGGGGGGGARTPSSVHSETRSVTGSCSSSACFVAHADGHSHSMSENGDSWSMASSYSSYSLLGVEGAGQSVLEDEDNGAKVYQRVLLMSDDEQGC